MENFVSLFSRAPRRRFSAPGRTELGGNHTDHQHGCVLAAAIDLDTTADVAENDLMRWRLYSEGYGLSEVDLTDLARRESEVGTSTAVVRGVAARLAELGYPLRGFDAYVTSRVLPGSGLSSSAAFEVLVGTVANALCCGGALTAVEIARIGQWAENVYFGKPCGLMDQTASSVGGVVAIDFKDPARPVVEPITFDLTGHGYALCMIDTGSSHADLTGEYAAIPREMGAVSRYFGKEVLRDVAPADFYADLSGVRRVCGDRAVLRAMHFFEENTRAQAMADALRQGDLDAYLRLVRDSGESSWLYLQNVTPAGATEQQPMALTLALCRKLLGGAGAARVHGGGFAGCVQCYVPLALLPDFRRGIEAALGEGRCTVLSFRAAGGTEI